MPHSQAALLVLSHCEKHIRFSFHYIRDMKMISLKLVLRPERGVCSWNPLILRGKLSRIRNLLDLALEDTREHTKLLVHSQLFESQMDTGYHNLVVIFTEKERISKEKCVSRMLNTRSREYHIIAIIIILYLFGVSPEKRKMEDFRILWPLFGTARSYLWKEYLSW